MDEKTKFRLFVGILAAVIILGVVFVVGLAVAEDMDDLWIVSPAVVLVVIAVAATFVARKRLKEMKSGIPSEDERLTALKMRAGYISFFASMYLCLALGWIFGVLLEDTETEVPSTGMMMFILVAVMGSMYLAIWAAITRGKGMP